MQRIIFHIDVNSAFLSWEAIYRLKFLGGTVDLRTIPSAIGGDMSKRHGIILAKSIPAKLYHIQTGESIPDALKKCPGLYLAPPNYNLYQQCSKAFMEILKEYTPDVEQYSIDEAFLDMTGTKRLWGDPVAVAHEIKARIRDELGFTVNVGVSTNKLLAKMASDFKKPDRVHTLFPEEIPEKMWPLSVSDLFFVGKATTSKLFSLGIRTIGDLAQADPRMLKSQLKKQGEIIWGLANGIDMSKVETETPPNKGYGNSTTVPHDIVNTEEAKLVLLALAETVSTRLRKDQVKAEVIAVGIKDDAFRHYSHQRVLDSPTDITKEIYRISCELFEESWDGMPIRHLGIHTSRMRDWDAVRQISFFDEEDYGKLTKMDHAIDGIRERFGKDSVLRATFLADTGIDHMSGGISREKRSVDYSKLEIE